MKKKIERGDKEYRWVPWYEWIYEVNEDWQIRSYWKKKRWYCELSKEPQRLLSHWVNRKKKLNAAQVTLFDWDTRTHKYVSRLVAQSFMGYDVNDKTKQVIFVDWNAMNPKKENLRIATISERTFNWRKLQNAQHNNIAWQKDLWNIWQPVRKKHKVQSTESSGEKAWTMTIRKRKLMGVLRNIQRIMERWMP